MKPSKSQQKYIFVGRIYQENRQKAKYNKLLNNTEKKLLAAKEELRLFGMYEDCGDSYRENKIILEEYICQLKNLQSESQKELKTLVEKFKIHYPEDKDLIKGLE